MNCIKKQVVFHCASLYFFSPRQIWSNKKNPLPVWSLFQHVLMSNDVFFWRALECNMRIMAVLVLILKTKCRCSNAETDSKPPTQTDKAHIKKTLLINHDSRLNKNIQTQPLSLASGLTYSFSLWSLPMPLLSNDLKPIALALAHKYSLELSWPFLSGGRERRTQPHLYPLLLVAHYTFRACRIRLEINCLFNYTDKIQYITYTNLLFLF